MGTFVDEHDAEMKHAVCLQVTAHVPPYARATAGPKIQSHPSHGDGATVGLSPQDMSITFDLLLSVQATKARESGGGGSSELRVYHRRTGWRNISVALSVC